MIAPKNAKAAKNVATIEAAYVRLRNRWSGTIGSFARDSAQMKSDDPDEGDEDEAADGRIGPVVELVRRRVGLALLGQADEQEGRWRP